MIKHPIRFEHISGFVVLAAMGLALILVNSPLASIYELIHHAPLSIQVNTLVIDKPLILWINDGLMVFFFVLVGLEIKREVVSGELSSLSRVALPGIAAAGGMLMPALIYLLFTLNNPETRNGWAIPTATDPERIETFSHRVGNL